MPAVMSPLFARRGETITTFSRLPTLHHLVLLLFFATLNGWASNDQSRAAVESRAPFHMEINGRTLHYTIGFEPVMPGEEVVFTLPKHLATRVSLRIDGRSMTRTQRTFVWRAPPQAGLRTAEITLAPASKTATRQTMIVQLFVMVPATRVKDGYLNGYRIGQYPSPLRNLAAYRPPRGFIEVTPAMKATRISPNFTLEQFLCKQTSGYPKYLVLQPELLTKLEELLLEVNALGTKTATFVVMSGYRTPYYNRAIKNVPSSYHIYGGAADIYVDVHPRDGVMDDLNGDGKQDRADAAYLYKMADSFVTRHNRPDLTGGVGEYGSNAAHGPFIHIDVRGSHARWGHKD